jgi:hypothetical protein
MRTGCSAARWTRARDITDEPSTIVEMALVHRSVARKRALTRDRRTGNKSSASLRTHQNGQSAKAASNCPISRSSGEHLPCGPSGKELKKGVKSPHLSSRPSTTQRHDPIGLPPSLPCLDGGSGYAERRRPKRPDMFLRDTPLHKLAARRNWPSLIRASPWCPTCVQFERKRRFFERDHPKPGQSPSRCALPGHRPKPGRGSKRRTGPFPASASMARRGTRGSTPGSSSLSMGKKTTGLHPNAAHKRHENVHCMEQVSSQKLTSRHCSAKRRRRTPRI